MRGLLYIRYGCCMLLGMTVLAERMRRDAVNSTLDKIECPQLVNKVNA